MKPFLTVYSSSQDTQVIECEVFLRKRFRETVETVLMILASLHTGLKPGVNESKILRMF